MLKLSSPGKQSIKVRVDGGTSLGDLVSECAKTFGLQRGVLQLLVGFPPLPVAEEFCMSPLATLAEVGIKPGDTVTCHEGLPATLLPPRRHCLNDPPLPASTGASKLQRHVIDADNSCLFNSILYAASHNDYPSAASLRSAVSSLVRLKSKTCDDVMFSEAFLGKDPYEYAAWINDANKWGGEVEMSLISTFLLDLEIRAVDVATGIVYSYGGNESSLCIFLLYDGIHYDVIVGDHQRKFRVDDAGAEDAARALATEARNKRQFVDLSAFTTRCLVCQQGLTGQAEVQMHARSTGHTNFSEF